MNAEALPAVVVFASACTPGSCTHAAPPQAAPHGGDTSHDSLWVWVGGPNAGFTNTVGLTRAMQCRDIPIRSHPRLCGELEARAGETRTHAAAGANQVLLHIHARQDSHAVPLPWIRMLAR